jgi:hypothetical protein
VPLLALMLAPPTALGGESVTDTNTGIAVISLVSIVFGYLLIAALWYFVFSARARSRRRRGPPE